MSRCSGTINTAYFVQQNVVNSTGRKPGLLQFTTNLRANFVMYNSKLNHYHNYLDKIQGSLANSVKLVDT